MKKTLFWILAILITLGAAYFQRKTGPTYPKSTSFTFNQKEIKFKLPRSNGPTDCKIEIPVKPESLTGIIKYKRYPSDEPLKQDMLQATDSSLIAYLPVQAPAGKLLYKLSVFDHTGNTIFNSESVIIRFKGAVDTDVLIPHILLMFLAMLFSNIAGLYAMGNINTYKRWALTTFILMLIGGMIMGPIMQFQAFGEYWTGFPKGYDLTDNKTLLAFVMWIAALTLNLKKNRPIWIIAAAIFTLIIFSIPHSLFGSELNYETGKVIQGMISLF